VASLKAGTVQPSVMLRKLAAYERQNQLDLALREIGRVERTLFMLDWLESAELRGRCQAGLNKSEQRHFLTGATVSGLWPAARASACSRPVRAITRSNSFRLCVPSVPAKGARPPTAFSPATRPCLCAIVPSEIHVGAGSRR